MPKTLGIWEWGCPYHCDAGFEKVQLSESLEKATFTPAPNWPARVRAPEHIEIRCSFVGFASERSE